eukprot:2268542-Pleurochrysis_carterae.AAC.1
MRAQRDCDLCTAQAHAACACTHAIPSPRRVARAHTISMRMRAAQVHAACVRVPSLRPDASRVCT